MSDELNLSFDEIATCKEKTSNYFASSKARLALKIFEQFGNASTSKASRDSLHDAWPDLYSDAGKHLLILLGGDASPELTSYSRYVETQLADPVLLSHPAVWALFFAAREASDRLQLDDCPSPTEESHLSGQLLEALAYTCDAWRQPIKSALGRLGSSLTLQKLDLTIGGGEQATGGDFGLILDFGSGAIGGSRIVPLLFQAKRYSRPDADISQWHRTRGYQRDAFVRNDCESAYIFYENSTKPLTNPLPPLVKSTKHIQQELWTDATQDTLELATYLVTRLCCPSRAPGAQDAQEAVEMIYAKGIPAFLTVISDDPTAYARYEHALKMLENKDSGPELTLW